MSTTTERRVIVIGAGIIGAAIAWHIARDGAHVTVIEAGEPGGIATPCSFGWVNATYGNPKPYFDLRMAAMLSWHRLSEARPGLPFHVTGSVYLHMDDHDGGAVDLDAFTRSHTEWGYDIRLIAGEELRRRAPNVRHLPDIAAWASCEAVAEGDDTARLLLADLTATGGTLITGTSVDKLTTNDERVTGVETALGPILADEIVVAAGTATPKLVAGVAPPIPLETPSGILLHTHPVAPLIPHLTLARDLHIRQQADGSLLAGWDFTGKPGDDDPRIAAEQIIDHIRNTFTGADDIAIADVSVGYRPTPGDGFPVVGRPGNTPGLTVAVMHSGITLAPFVGETVVALLRDDVMHPLFAPFGPDRF